MTLTDTLFFGEILAAIIYSAILFYLWLGLKKLRAGRNEKQKMVSVIVAARNEEKNLLNCLHALTRQNYPHDLFEIIIINDRSEDTTGEIIRGFCERQPNATWIEIPKTRRSASPKKWALSQGIDRAAGEILCFTDADCEPSPAWISEIVRCFEPDVEMVAGFSPLISEKKNFPGGIIELDSLAASTLAAAALGQGRGVTCNGRNLAYTKKIYQTVNGFQKIAHSLSGDDDLFLHLVQAEKPGSVRFCLSPGSIVPAQRLTGIRAFLRQRRRHISAGGKYPFGIKLGYFFYHASNFVLFTGFLLSGFENQNFLWAFAVLSAKFFGDFFVIYNFTKLMNYRKPLRYWFAWEFYFYFLNSFVGPTSFVGKVRWK